MSDDVEIKIDVDASAVAGGASTASSAIANLQKEVVGLAEEMKVLESATEEEVLSLKEIAESVSEAGEAIVEAKESIMEFGEALLAAFAIEEIADWASEMAEAGEHAEQLGARLGATTAEIQQWQAAATLTGRDVNQFAQAMTRLTDAAAKAAAGSKLQADAFKELGISAKDATNPQETMLQLADKFAEMHEAGETGKEIAAAMALMGRSGADMIPILNQGRAGIEAMMGKGAEFGTVLDSLGNEKVAGAAKQINEFKLRMQGLSEQAFVQLIPQIEAVVNGFGRLVTAIEQAIQPGSQFRDILGQVTTAAIAVGAALTTYLVGGMVATAAKTVLATEVMQAFGLVNTEAVALMVGESVTLDGLGAAFALFTGAVAAASAGVLELTVALLANPLTWIAVGVAAAVYAYETWGKETKAVADAHRDLKTAEEQADAATAELTGKTQIQLDKLEDEVDDLVQVARAHLAAAEAALVHAKAEDAAAQATARASAADGQLIGAADLMAEKTKKAVNDATESYKTQEEAVEKLLAALTKIQNAKPAEASTFKGAPAKDKSKDDRVAEWEAELQDKHLAERNFWQDDLAGDKAFWASKLAIIESEAPKTPEKLREQAKQIRAISQKMFDDDKAMANQGRTELLDELTGETKAQADAEAAKTAVTLAGIAARVNAVQQAAKRGEINPGQEMAQLTALNEEKIAAEKAYAEAVYNIQMGHLAANEDIYQMDQKNLDKVHADMTAAAAKLQQQLTTITAKGEQDRQKIEQAAATANVEMWKARVAPIVSSFGTSLEGMINGTKTFQQAVVGIFQSLESSILKAIETQVTNWIAGELAKTTSTQANNTARVASTTAANQIGLAQEAGMAIKDVAMSAARAGAGAYAAIASVPVVGPVLAPAAAAVAFAGAYEFVRTIASAEGGYDIPTGINPLVQTHENEMILPARIANPLRTVLSNVSAANDSGGAGAAQSGGGDTHHHWNIQAVDAKSVQRLFDTHADAMQRSADRQTRNLKVGGGRR